MNDINVKTADSLLQAISPDNFMSGVKYIFLDINKLNEDFQNIDETKRLAHGLKSATATFGLEALARNLDSLAADGFSLEARRAITGQAYDDVARLCLVLGLSVPSLSD